MADNNDTDFEDEFDFESDDSLLDDIDSDFEPDTNADSDSAYSSAAPSKKPPLPVLVGAGVVGLLIIGGIFFMLSGGEDELPEPLPEPEPLPVVEPEPLPAPPPPPVDPFADPNADPDEPRITGKMVMEEIEALSSQEKNLSNKVQSLESKMNQLLSQISRLQSSLNSATKDNAGISRKLEALNQELKMMAAPKKPETVVVEKEATIYVNPTFVVHAIIPGRAWLKAADGRTITVTEGDNIEGYGKVLAIDAPTGQVLTSSGVVLR